MADADLTLLLKEEQDMQQALDILAEFSTFSGLEINRRQCGSVVNKTALTPFLGDLYGRGDSKLLVCILPVTSQVEENWTGRVENIKRRINGGKKKKKTTTEHC